MAKIFSEEVQVIEQTADVICNSDSDCHHAAIFTVAPTVMQARSNGNLSYLRVVLSKVSQTKNRITVGIISLWRTW